MGSSKYQFQDHAVWFSELKRTQLKQVGRNWGDRLDRLPNSLTFGGPIQADEPWLSNMPTEI